MSFDRQLFIPSKKAYVKGENRPKVDCILCEVNKNNPEIDNLIIWKNDIVAASVNLYPYTSGHVLIFPVRHITETKQLNEDEVMQMHKLQVYTIDVLKELYKPGGFNIGYNMGYSSGASIEHLHQHIVPRYQRELGFVDIISGTKIFIEDPRDTMKNLLKAFKDFKI
jgi:ATP adenylyltransferase